MKLFFILGNQLFPLKYVDRFKKDHSFYMAEDYELCTYEKHHKQKILLFLSSMRSYADMLKVNKYKVEYSKIEDKDFKDTYFKKLKIIIDKNSKIIWCGYIEPQSNGKYNILDKSYSTGKTYGASVENISLSWSVEIKAEYYPTFYNN